MKPLAPGRRLAIQYEIVRALAEANELRDVSGFLLRTLTTSLGWLAGGVWVADETGASITCVDTLHHDASGDRWNERTRGLTFEAGVGLPGRVLAQATPIWVSDLYIDEGFQRRWLAAEVGLRHGYAFPVLVRGRVRAVIELFKGAVREPDSDQAAFLAAVGYQLGSFLERTEARRAVASSEARKAGILQAALDAIVSADASGRISEFNAAAETMFGYRRDEAIGRHIVDLLVPPDLRVAHTAGLTRYLETRTPHILGQRVRVPVLRADGTTLPVELTVTAIELDGTPMFTAFIRDVSREQEAATARERFLAILSHELRTPITAIYGGATLVGRPDLPGDRRAELLADIGNEADRLYRLVEDLIVLARAERGRDSVALEPVHVERVTERVVRSVRSHWPDVDFQLSAVGSSQAVQGDETYLEQLVRNLLTNSAKYARVGWRDHGCDRARGGGVDRASP